MASHGSEGFLSVLVVGLLTAALVVPSALPADAGTDRCIDVEVVSTPDTLFDDEPLFDVDVTTTVDLRLQLTDGDQGGGWTDDMGTFDCPGNPLAATVALEVWAETQGLSLIHI